MHISNSFIDAHQIQSSLGGNGDGRWCARALLERQWLAFEWVPNRAPDGRSGWPTSCAPRSRTRTGSGCRPGRTDPPRRIYPNQSSSSQNQHQQVKKSQEIPRNPKRCRLLPLVALLAGEAVQVVNVALGPHHHLEGRDDFAARGTVARRPEQPAKINGINHQMIWISRP